MASNAIQIHAATIVIKNLLKLKYMGSESRIPIHLYALHIEYGHCT